MKHENGPRIELRGRGTLEATWGGTRALYEPSGAPVSLAHLGCQHVRKSVKKVSELPDSVREQCERKYGSSWSKQRPAVETLAGAVSHGAESVGLSGAMLVDTMRTGSDYWRPGKLLSDVANSLRARGLDVAYAREDAVCPGASLIARLRADDSLEFSEYAALYESELLAEDSLGLRVAAFLTVAALSSELLTGFYSSDPYVPGFPKPEGSGATPFSERAYPTDPSGYLRTRGCHRVVLVECLSRFFAALDVDVTLVEIDANVGTCYQR